MSVLCLKLIGEPKDGGDVEVHVPLDDVWQEISDEMFVAELHDRADEKSVAEAIEALAPEPDEDDWGDDRSEDEMFRTLDAWAKAELLKAIREDDGRRCIDVLKRAAA